MLRLTVAPVLRALRVQHLPARATGSSARRYTTHPPPPPPTRVQISEKAAKSFLDPSCSYNPSQYVSAQLESPDVQYVINTLLPDDLATYNSMYQRLQTTSGHADILAVNDMGQFLETRGVDLHLPDSLFEPPNPTAFDESGDNLLYTFTDIKKPDGTTHRSLMEPIPHLDTRDVLDLPPDNLNPYGGRVTIRNHDSIFESLPPPSSSSSSSSSSNAGGGGTTQTYALPMGQVKNLYQSILISRTVKQQTGKGKIMRKFFLVLVGDGNGLIGYGQAKDLNARLALQKARINAVRDMDWVERFEQRTVWTEMETTLGATKLLLRPRPVGFGLRCNPYLHQILRAAGFKDISAKVWGSRNKLNVIKAAFRMLHAGHAPVAMGDGVGGKGKKLSKGIGMQGKIELERARGRKLVSLRK